ncbi:MAG: hypothetical protein R3B82_27435 [Sandaracinaceae bacterium]
MPSSKRFGSATVTFDDRFVPIIVVVWEGQTTLEAAKWGMEQQQRVMSELTRRRERFILVSDASGAHRPSPEVRRFFATASEEQPVELRRHALSSYVVLSSGLMRGVMTAVGWLSEAARSVRSVATLREALERSLEDLDAAGVTRPEGLDPTSYDPSEVRARTA